MIRYWISGFSPPYRQVYFYVKTGKVFGCCRVVKVTRAYAALIEENQPVEKPDAAPKSAFEILLSNRQKQAIVKPLPPLRLDFVAQPVVIGIRYLIVINLSLILADFGSIPPLVAMAWPHALSILCVRKLSTVSHFQSPTLLCPNQVRMVGGLP